MFQCTEDVIPDYGVTDEQNVTNLARELEDISIFPENKGCTDSELKEETQKLDSLKVYGQTSRERLSEESEETNLPLLEQDTNSALMSFSASAQVWPQPVPLGNQPTMAKNENFLADLSELHLCNIQKLEEWKPGGQRFQDAANQERFLEFTGWFMIENIQIQI